MKRVVVTGLGALTPIGNNVEDFWNNLIAGKSGVGLITKFDTTPFKTKFAAELKGFDPLQYMEKPEARKMDAYSQYALAVTHECLADSKIDLASCNLGKFGVIWGTGIGGIQTFEDEVM